MSETIINLLKAHFEGRIGEVAASIRDAETNQRDKVVLRYAAIFVKSLEPSYLIEPEDLAEEIRKAWRVVLGANTKLPNSRKLVEAIIALKASGSNPGEVKEESKEDAKIDDLDENTKADLFIQTINGYTQKYPVQKSQTFIKTYERMNGDPRIEVASNLKAAKITTLSTTGDFPKDQAEIICLTLLRIMLGVTEMPLDDGNKDEVIQPGEMRLTEAELKASTDAIKSFAKKYEKPLSVIRAWRADVWGATLKQWGVSGHHYLSRFAGTQTSLARRMGVIKPVAKETSNRGVVDVKDTRLPTMISLVDLIGEAEFLSMLFRTTFHPVSIYHYYEMISSINQHVISSRGTSLEELGTKKKFGGEAQYIAMENQMQLRWPVAPPSWQAVMIVAMAIRQMKGMSYAPILLKVYSKDFDAVEAILAYVQANHQAHAQAFRGGSISPVSFSSSTPVQWKGKPFFKGVSSTSIWRVMPLVLGWIQAYLKTTKNGRSAYEAPSLSNWYDQLSGPISEFYQIFYGQQRRGRLSADVSQIVQRAEGASAAAVQIATGVPASRQITYAPSESDDEEEEE